MFKAVINDKFVTKYNEKSEDWSGDAFNIAVDETITSNNKDDLIEKVSDFFALSVQEFKNYYDDDYNQLSIVENSQGYTDNKGKYLCDYFIVFFETIDKQISLF